MRKHIGRHIRISCTHAYTLTHWYTDTYADTWPATMYNARVDPTKQRNILTKRSAKVPKYLYILTCPHTPISPSRNSRCKNPRSRNSGACHCPGGISPLKNKNRLEWNFPISRFLLLEPGVLTRPRICVPAYLRNSLGFLGGPC